MVAYAHSVAFVYDKRASEKLHLLSFDNLVYREQHVAAANKPIVPLVFWCVAHVCVYI
uniref:DekiORF34 n=1 Tax=Dendrolimus kikuchii nucleopolyhedrovirus TaxID=1219875 RepID=V9LSS4_9ABAC|nr:DekiORF34 [Dendrolimus kikuchii nucleopolyhedrovirus]